MHLSTWRWILNKFSWTGLIYSYLRTLALKSSSLRHGHGSLPTSFGFLFNCHFLNELPGQTLLLSLIKKSNNFPSLPQNPPSLFSFSPALFFFHSIYCLTGPSILLIYFFLNICLFLECRFHEGRDFHLHCSQLYLQHLEYYLTHRRHSTNIYWVKITCENA